MSARHSEVSEVSSTGWLDTANAHQETIRHPPTSIGNVLWQYVGLEWHCSLGVLSSDRPVSQAIAEFSQKLFGRMGKNDIQ